MTIAACYLSTEGVVLGADSTATMFVQGPPANPLGSFHHYNFAQKVFELGEQDATAGVVLWGLGSLGDKSYRTLFAEIADEGSKMTSLADIANLAAARFWAQYSATFGLLLLRVRDLLDKNQNRTPDEEKEYLGLMQNLSGGFCVGGRWRDNRSPAAFEVLFSPASADAPQPRQLQLGSRFWGWSNLIERLVFGMDEQLYLRIEKSGKWNGTPEELIDLVSQGALAQPQDLPLREAIDWIYASIYTTIKSVKFSHLAPVCGGPIEVAVVTSDRPFRWVRHKRLGEAISAHQTQEGKP